MADPSEQGALGADPLEGDPRVAEYLGEHFAPVRAFGALLAEQGALRGLIGPREVARLWERHLLNSAAVVPFLPPGTIVDVGSGAGLPGLVVAAMRPGQRVLLVEPMERRTAWLEEAAAALGLRNVEVVRGRAEELEGRVVAEGVTARAVAPLGRLAKWCAPLLAPGGRMCLLKGRGAHDEVAAARHSLRRLGLAAEVLEAPTLPGLEPTRVVRLSPTSPVSPSAQ